MKLNKRPNFFKKIFLKRNKKLKNYKKKIELSLFNF